MPLRTRISAVLLTSILLISQNMRASDLPVSGNLSLEPVTPADSNRQITLTFAGWSDLTPTTDSHGMTLTYADTSVAVGVFRIHRPAGGYEWQLSNASDGSGRLAMQLNDDHKLFLRSRTRSSGAGDLWDIELRPGNGGGVFFGGTRLATVSEIPSASPTSLAFGGGVANAPGYVWSEGLLMGGTGAIAKGSNSIALGNHAFVNGDNGAAIGLRAIAGGYAYGIGYDVSAGWNTAVFGRSSDAVGYCSTALGTNSHAYGDYSMSLSNGYAYGDSSFAFIGNAFGQGAIALVGFANGNLAFANAWGTADGESSVSHAGYTGPAAYKSFAAGSGSTFGKYGVAIGRGAYSNQPYQVALGVYNEPADTNLLFMLGNGTIDDTDPYNPIIVRHNAMTVSKQGDLEVSGVIRTKEASGDIGMGAFTARPQ